MSILKSKWLQRSHKIYDAVHGFIRFNELEKQVIDSEPFQRLHGIHQLGIAYLVYPGATHTRFEHSLGTMHLATSIFERIVSKGFVLDDPIYWEQVVRFAALCHDFGHLPFSHDAEKELLGEGGHEGWTLKAIFYLKPLFERFQEFFAGKDILGDVIKMAIGEEKLSCIEPSLIFSAEEKVLSQIVTGDFFGADRIDYLLRDAQCTGVSHGLFDYQQLIEMLTVADMQMCIEENGVESCEALLLARHFMHKRVYGYPSVRICKFHLASFMKLFFEGQDFLENIEAYFSLTDHEILAALRKAAKDPLDKGHLSALSLLDRHKRFKPIILSKEFSEEILVNLGIDRNAFWMEPFPKVSSKGKPNFLVKTKAGQVMPATSFCQIVFQPKSERMLYLSPDVEKRVQEVLA
ncbi:MAG: hypothetical protein RLZZ453_87 [Chlamydiota bacterium]|jgi:HD superfamily phosphohydrolase